MLRTSQLLRDDALRIWQAGVDAVLPERLIADQVVVDGDVLRVGDVECDLQNVRRIAIVGAGKAAAGMTIAIENVLGDRLLEEKQVAGWVNVPADCIMPTKRVKLHAGRPAGINEPRPEGVAGTGEILEIVESLNNDDLCLCLLAGGGSALLVAPPPEVSLAEKVAITKLLSDAGANIEQLNTVRRQISLVKGGGLACACRAGQLVSLILSDVLGDPLDTIASGPTTPSSTTAVDALQVLSDLHLIKEPAALPIVQYLTNFDANLEAEGCPVTNLILGNNAVAVDAAGIEAERLGYSHAMIAETSSEGPAEAVGKHLAEMALRMQGDSSPNGGPDCLISGGEPVVQLVDETVRGKGGRNQQLALAALIELGDCEDIALLSGGTDGEDGPTDAAGAVIDADLARNVAEQGLEPQEFLRRNDAYSFFDATGGLIKTGPTHTNVCDVRVVTVSRADSRDAV